nr:ABC transporter ATP-binding protein [uncultured Peptostreptococcus sp.]
MKKILSYFTKYIPMILLLILVLGLEVKFELLLPSYTSNIVNIGIQQAGIENSIPRVMDEQTYATMLSLSDLSHKSKIARAYERWSPSNDKEVEKNNKNSHLINQSRRNKVYYLLKNNVKEDDLNDYMVNSLVNMASYMASNPKKINIQIGYMTNLVSDKKMPDFMKKQISIRLVSQIYKNLGIDTGKIQKKYLWKTGGKMLIFSIFAGFLSIGVSFIAVRVATSVSRTLRHDSFIKVLSFSNTEMDKFSISSLIARCTNDIQQIQQSSILGLRFLFYGPLMAIGAFSRVFELDVSMLWIIGLAIIVTVLSIVVIMGFALPKFRIVQDVVDKMNLVTREFISGIEVNRVFVTGKHEEERFDKVNTELTGINLFINRSMSLMQPLMIFVMDITTLLIIWFGAKQIDSGNIQVGDMMAFIQYTMQIIISFLFITMMSVMLPRAMVSANRISDVLTSQVSIENKGTIRNFDKEGSLVFDNVSFKYEGAHENVIEDISFEVKKGKTLAIIGSTGSGKTTIVNLIPRFLEATSGKIYLDGVEVGDIPMSIIRDKVSIIPQKSVLFSGSIISNIEYAKSIRSYKKAKMAAEISQSMEFINNKPEGLDSKVSQGGANLSGGQRQRLAIARAIARNPEIIVFDDSFSALDSKTDKMLRSKIHDKLKDKALIIIAQRINTIINADEIIVLDDGKIVARGKHKDLLGTCDVYREIAKSQLAEGELKNVR